MGIEDYKFDLEINTPTERSCSVEDKILGRVVYTLGDAIDGKSKYLSLQEKLK